MAAEDYKVIDIHHLDEIKSTPIIIYGAGWYGSELCMFLKLNGFRDRIVCFAVSHKEDNPDFKEGIPVKEVSELKDELLLSTVLVAIGKTHAGEVISLLESYKVKSMYRVTSETIENISDEIFYRMKDEPLEQNKIFISCYEGRGYWCNCKYIAEKLLQGRYPVKIVWVVKEEKGREIPNEIKKVRVCTEEYYRELYTSKICITNNTIRLFGQKKKGQYYINTWHGFGPFKKVQGSVPVNKDRLDEIKEINSKYDLFLTGSSFYSQVYRESFFYEGEIYECGAPRNDVFFKDNRLKDSVYKKFGIPSEKKVMLYAPTFRTALEDSFEKYDLSMPEILEALNKRFEEEYVLLYRFHNHLCEMGKGENYYEEGIDVTYYPDIQELLVAADVVITDYSSLMWDFSLQKRPVFLYQNDEKDYIDDRGFYAPVSEWPYPQAHTQAELLENIRNFNYEKYEKDLSAFLEKYGSCDDGNASRRVADKIMEIINDGT